MDTQDKLCECGCGQTVKRRYVLGHYYKDKTFTAEHRKNMSEAHKGIKFTEERLKNMSKALTGKKCSEETRKKIGLANRGKKRSKEHIQIISKTHKGKKLTIEHRKKISKACKGRFFSEESKKKMRLATIKRIEQNCDQCWPNYNLKACEFFKSFDEQNNTKGKYAVYGGGEYRIKELGYWLDYFNSDLKLIIECDEWYHYDVNGNLKEHDVIRQKEIQTYFPDFEFRRIKAKELDKNYA